MLQKEKKVLEGQVKQFRDQRSSWVDKTKPDIEDEELKTQTAIGEAAIAAGGATGPAVAALEGENSDLRKKIRSLAAELDSLKKKEADQEE